MKFLLKPGWLGGILLVIVFSTLCFSVLAPWQFSRDEQAQARNTAIQESFHAQPKPIEEVLPGGAAPSASTEWTKVRMRGEFLPEAETLAWLRTVQGEPAIEVLTPFRQNNGETMLINRGYVRPVDGSHAPDYPAAPEGKVTLTARVHSDETDAENRPTFEREGHEWTYAVDSRTVSEGTGVPLRPGYFALTADQPGVLSPLPLPHLESGPYFSYALQWIAFGVMAPLAIIYLVYAELRPTAPGNPAQPGSNTRGRRKLSVAEAIVEDERREREEAEAANRGSQDQL